MKPAKAISAILERIGDDRRGALLCALSDIIVLLDESVLVTEVHGESEKLVKAARGRWVGRPFADSLTIESRTKLEELLASGDKISPARQVNHPLDGANDLPVLYTLVSLDGSGWIAFGRDLHAMSEMQQLVVQFQVAKERDYARLRSWETRFRILSESIDEPVFVLDGSNYTINDHNSAAKRFLDGKSRRKLVGRQLTEFFAPGQAEAITEGLATARGVGRNQEIDVEIGAKDHQLVIAPFRMDGGTALIARLKERSFEPSLLNGHDHSLTGWSGTPMAFERMPEGIVTTDMEGTIIVANEAFIELIELPGPDHVSGMNLSNWLGRPDVDLGVLLGQLRNHGRVRAYSTTLNGNFGTVSQIEVTAAADADGLERRATFLIRDLGNRPDTPFSLEEALPQSAAELTQLVGRVPLKELVRQTTDVIERLCIESALQLTNENRASAAELLGLSRQGLYVKLRRYGIIDEVQG